MARLIGLLYLIFVFHQAHSTYVAFAPMEFHPGWKYSVQLTVLGARSPGVRVTVAGNIFNARKQSLGAGIVSLDDGQSARLQIQVGDSITLDPDNQYTLQLDGTGGLVFSNSTPVRLAPLTYLTFIQTDRKIYRAGQLVRFRVLTVDKDLVPKSIPKNITIENPNKITLARFFCNGSKSVYENTYPLTEFPDIGEWQIVVRSKHDNIDEALPFTVEQEGVPAFEVSARITPTAVARDSSQKTVMVAVIATDNSGKGVLGSIRLTVMGSNQMVNSKITATNGEKNLKVDLTKELLQVADHGDISIRVEVTDATRKTYETMATVRVVRDSVKFGFDIVRTDLVYRPGMSFQAVVTLTDFQGLPLDAELLKNQMTMSLTEGPPRDSLILRELFTLTPGQKEVVWNISRLFSTASTLHLKASVTLNGKIYEACQLVRKYETLGNASLTVRWTSYYHTLNMGSTASFVVQAADTVNFTSVTYMVVSRGNIQDFGSVVPGQTTNVKVTPAMCPRGRLVVYGITSESIRDALSEVIADSLFLTLEHCQDKQVTCSVMTPTQMTGRLTALDVNVTWTDPDKSQVTPIGQHDVYLLAVDRNLLLRHGDNDITSDLVEANLERFHKPSGAALVGVEGTLDAGNQTTAASIGELMQELGVVIMTDMNSVFSTDGNPNFVSEDSKEVSKSTPTSPEATGSIFPLRKSFPDTWIWKTAKTDDLGMLTLEDSLPNLVTSWIITAFAVRQGAPVAFTAHPLELRGVNRFYVKLNLPNSIRRSEKFQLKATVFNNDNFNIDTRLTVSPSDDYIISGEATATTMVERTSDSSVQFWITAIKVGVLHTRVTAVAKKYDGTTIMETADEKLLVKPEGVKRTRVITLPVLLSAEQPVFDRNVSVDFWPWTLQDIVKDSRQVQVKIVGDMLGSVLEDTDQAEIIPIGSGEQNLKTIVAGVVKLVSRPAVPGLEADFEVKVKESIKLGYIREVQQYRWSNGGFSAFGTKDQAASTWLTACVLRSFAHARMHVPETIDLEIIDSAVDFLFSCQNTGSGFFFENGRILHNEMREGSAAVDALTSYVVIAMLEARRYGMAINSSRLSLAVSYVHDMMRRELAKENLFVAAVAAYALVLNATNSDYNRFASHSALEQFIDGIVLSSPWLHEDEALTAKFNNAAPREIEITAYCLLAYTHINRIAKGLSLLLWLQRQQNNIGGFRSTQDTALALQAIAEYSVKFSRTVPSSTVALTAVDRPEVFGSVHVDKANAALLQIIQLPEDSNKIHIKVTGNVGNLVVVKVVWQFYTAPETDRTPPGQTGAVRNNNRKLIVSTRTSMVQPGFYNVQTCVKPEMNLAYDNVVMVILSLPSGFVLEDLQKTREENPGVMRIEEKSDQVHFFTSQPRYECVHVMIEEKVKVENLKAGTAVLYAYYQPAIKSEAEIQIPCTHDGSCKCTGDNCGSSNASCPVVSYLLLVISSWTVQLGLQRY